MRYVTSPNEFADSSSAGRSLETKFRDVFCIAGELGGLSAAAYEPALVLYGTERRWFVETGSCLIQFHEWASRKSAKADPAVDSLVRERAVALVSYLFSS